MNHQTKVFKITSENFSDVIRECAEIIRRGGTVAIPTETVYGLGANALDPIAVNRIFHAKGRPADNPLIVHVASVEQVEQLVIEIPPKALSLIEAFWPGPLTLILKRTAIVPDITTGGLDTVAVRMPADVVARELIRISDKPIAAPSANISGRPSPTSAAHVLHDLEGRIDAVIDAGSTCIGVESTVIDMSGGKPAVLRPGYVSEQKIEEIIGEVDIGYSDHVTDVTDVVRSPGMKYTHYSPSATVLLLEGPHNLVLNKISEMYADFTCRGARVGLLVTSTGLSSLTNDIVYLGSKDEPEEVARNLFLGLRSLDERGVNIILADGSFTHEGVGAAVMNRLRKASEMIIKL
ncbi:L-threonylcarbamoyladenylate synthase [Methanomethylovorans sp.]|uniref:L-threonylcarbamoyladenylate synthase n=1 Tax=Methanomethylovorans sp. TaxID=2758717 RepID=UPI00351C21A3